jgi:2-methylisocitrate lyase-like PEP mutase family enzyme
MLRAVARNAAAVEVPVTADLEAGYGDPPRTAAGAVAAGAAGMNLEDSRAGQLLALEEQLEVIRAVRAAAPALVVNARVDVFIEGNGDVAEAIERGNAYLGAGADCVYPIVAPLDTVATLVNGIDGPVNILVAPHDPPLAELERLGVARVTFGSGLARVALDEAARLAASALAGGR